MLRPQEGRRLGEALSPRYSETGRLCRPFPPTVPPNFHAWGAGDGSTEIDAFWNASTDDRTPQSLIVYEVYLNGEFADGTMGRTCSVMYGVNGTNTVEVIAIDAAGNRSAAATTIVEVP
jgi:hypothetical protein